MSDPTTVTVADVMQVAVRTVGSAMSLADLEHELLSAKVTGFPVVDQGKLVGIVSRSDVISRMRDEREIAHRTSDFYFDESGFFESKMESLKDIASRVGQRLEKLTVRDVMVTSPLTVAIDQPIHDVARRFVDHGVHRFPVVNQGELVGIVTTIDLVKLIANKRLK